MIDVSPGIPTIKRSESTGKTLPDQESYLIECAPACRHPAIEEFDETLLIFPSDRGPYRQPWFLLLTNIYLPLPILYASHREEVFSLQERLREFIESGIRG